MTHSPHKRSPISKLFGWNSRTLRWLNRRIPAARQYQLDLRSIFIFPSKFGWLYVTLCLGLFLLGTNYQNNLMRMLCYFLLAIFLLNLFAAYLNFAKIQIQLGKCHNVFAGDQLQLPLWLNTDKDKLPVPKGQMHFGFWRETPRVCVDLDQMTNPINLAVECQHRGHLRLPRVSINSYFPLGLFRCWTYLDFIQEIVVYPKPLPGPVKFFSSDEDGEAASNLSIQKGYDDFASLKTYQTGEPLNHVAWKQLAKGQGMLSKQFSSSVNQSLWLKLLPCPAEKLELQLSQLCYQLIALAQTQQVYGLQLDELKISPSSGAEHHTQCLTALALYKQNRASSNV
jgi:uncharacterized protein (DUF58 family)